METQDQGQVVDQGQTQGQDQVIEQNANTIDYGKLEEMINKGIQTKENGILKSYFSQMGLSEEEVKEAFDIYKTNKETKQKQEVQTSSEFVKLQKEFNKFKETTKQEKIQNTIQLEATNMGLDNKAIKALLKLQDFKNAMVDDTISNENIKANIDNFLNEYEVFKPKQNTNLKPNSFNIEIGAKQQEVKKETEMESMLKAIGLK